MLNTLHAGEGEQTGHVDSGACRLLKRQQVLNVCDVADPYVSFGINIEDPARIIDTTLGMPSISDMSDGNAALATGESFIDFWAVTVRPGLSSNTNVPNGCLVEWFHDSHSLDVHTHPDLWG